MSHARDTAICRNEICAWNGAARVVEWPVVASGAYLRGELRCACGWAMELLPEPVRPSSSQPAPVEPPVAGYSTLDLLEPHEPWFRRPRVRRWR